VLEIDERALGPQALSQLVARDDVAGTLEHQAQDLERLFLQPDASRALTQLTRAAIQLERRES
jgi:hypothetical protein